MSAPVKTWTSLPANAETDKALRADSGPYCEYCGARWRTEGHKRGCPCLSGYPCLDLLSVPVPQELHQ